MKKLFKVLLIVLVVAVIFSCSYKPVDVDSFNYSPDSKSKVYSSDGELIAELYNENRTYVDFEEIPEYLINAIVAVEDERFYEHKGYDIKGILRATLQNIKNREITEGASTITQQLARNLFEEITTEQTVLRKIKELSTARQLEKKYNKNEILEMYLNEIYLGSGVFGVQEASRHYFGKDVSELSLAECAMIAGLPQAPSAYAPDNNFDLAKKRQEIVLDRMVSNEYITEKEASDAKKEKIEIIEDNDQVSMDKNVNEFINRVVDQYASYLEGKYPDKDINSDVVMGLLKNGGFKVNTTLNSAMQERAVKALNNGIKSHGLEGIATGAIVSVDSETGQVLAYYGGNTEIDMANKPRQPGSTIKPLIYSKAFQDGIVTPNTLIKDEPIDYNGWKPKNYDGKYRGYITVREAIVNSVNIPAIKVTIELGIDETLNHLKSFGITTISEEDYGKPAISLGGFTYGISPLEMTQAYSVFTQGGVLNRVYFIESIEDSSGNIVYTQKDADKGSQRIIDEDSADDINQILTDVVSRGSGTKAKTGYETGGKTGTSDDNKDLWFTGITGDVNTTVWIGNVDNAELNGKSSYSAEVYGNYVSGLVDNSLIESKQLVDNYKEELLTITIISPEVQGNTNIEDIKDEDVITIEIPESQVSLFQSQRVTKAVLDKETSMLFINGRCPDANRYARYFYTGTEPTQYCNKSHVVDKLRELFQKR